VEGFEENLAQICITRVGGLLQRLSRPDVGEYSYNGAVKYWSERPENSLLRTARDECKVNDEIEMQMLTVSVRELGYDVAV